MVTEIENENLRGIRERKLYGLTPLTVLVGLNGAGKSTVLDALRWDSDRAARPVAAADAGRSSQALRPSPSSASPLAKRTHASQLDYQRRRRIMRRARSIKKRPLLLADLEKRYRDAFPVP